MILSMYEGGGRGGGPPQFSPRLISSAVMAAGQMSCQSSIVNCDICNVCRVLTFPLVLLTIQFAKQATLLEYCIL